MRRYFAGLAAITITMGTLVTAQSAGAFERYRAEGYDVTTFEPYERTSSPSWSPTWEPTWTPEPQMPEPTATYSAPTYASVPVSSGALSAEAVAAYALAAGFPADLVPTMVAIAQRESNLCPTAVYGYGCDGVGHAYQGGPSCGLWQIFECPGPDALDPTRNAALAYQKYVNAGYSLSPWAMTAP